VQFYDPLCRRDISSDSEKHSNWVLLWIRTIRRYCFSFYHSFESDIQYQIFTLPCFTKWNINDQSVLDWRVFLKAYLSGNKGIIRSQKRVSHSVGPTILIYSIYIYKFELRQQSRWSQWNQLSMVFRIELRRTFQLAINQESNLSLRRRFQKIRLWRRFKTKSRLAQLLRILKYWLIHKWQRERMNYSEESMGNNWLFWLKSMISVKI